MTKLSDTQSILLTAAAQRADGNLLPLPGSLRGGAATKVVAALLVRGLAEEQTVESTAAADPALNRSGATPTTGAASCCGSRRPVSTPSASRPTAPPWRPLGRSGAAGGTEGGSDAGSAPQAAASARSGKTREGTKQALLVGMLGRAEGATIDEIVAATGWQPHTVRGAFAGALKKRLGLTIVSEKVEGRGRVYRIG